MHENMNRVESAVTANSSGNLTWEQWPHDCATALGFAGQRNPLGFAVVRYISDGPTNSATWQLVLQLATDLVSKGLDAATANKTARHALYAWNRMSCNRCGGRGVISFEQETCPSCKGSGERDLRDWPEQVRDGVSALMEAERRMEGQLASRLRNHEPIE